jgi:hypothetical protein
MAGCECHITLLDGSLVRITIQVTHTHTQKNTTRLIRALMPLLCFRPHQPSLLGSELFNLVTSQFALHEKEYFGLAWRDGEK